MLKLWAFFLIASILAAQSSSTGSLQGTVTDPTGAPVAEVRVIARLQNGSTIRTAQTNELGYFSLNALPAGVFTLTLEKPGFAVTTPAPATISIGQVAVQRITMALAGVSQQLEVNERADALQPAATTSGIALGGERIEEAPAQNRNFLNFVLIAPAAAPSNGSNTGRSPAGVRNVTNDGGFVFAGLRGRNNAILIDGMDNRDETTGGNRVAIGLEMVQEFRVASTNVSAEFGGAAGGIVNVVTRAGVNLWHGDATFFAQNERLNARNPEVEQGKNRFRRYQPGVSLLGPLRRDQTFFAAALEQSWESGDEWSDVPGRVFHAVNPLLQQASYSGIAQRALLRGLFPTGETDTESYFKLTHQLTTAHTLSVRHAFSRGSVRKDVQAVDNFSDYSARGDSRIADQSVVAGWTAVASAAALNDIRFQWAKRDARFSPNGQGAMIEIPGVITFGQADRLNAARTERHHEVVESLQFMRGAHLLSIGGSAHWIDLGSRIANRFNGVYIFPTLEDFVRGMPDVFLQAFGEPATRQETLPIAFWLQDRWQPRRGLTVDTGVRYDYQRMPARLTSSKRNIAPRLGLAWQPKGSSAWVFRAGAGLFYDRFPLAYLNEAVQKNGVNAFEQYVVGQEAAAVFRITRGAALLAPLAGVLPSTYRTSQNFPSTYSRKLTAGLERRIDPDTTLTLEYSDVRGLHLPRIRNVRGTIPPLYELEQTAQSRYRGLTLSLHRRLRNDLTYLVAYTRGNTNDDASDYDEQPLNPFNVREDWGRSRQHLPHRIAVSGLFELEEEKLHGLPSWLRNPLQGITFAPVATFGSQRPVNTLETTDTQRTGAYPLSARPLGFARNTGRTPRTVFVDLRIMKTFLIRNERARLQFGIESFNLLNHTNVVRVSPYYTSTFAKPTEINTPRQVQWMAQIEF